MEKRGLKRGLATLFGGGSGQAIIIEGAENPMSGKLENGAIPTLV